MFLTILRRHRVARAAAAFLFLFGCAWGSTAPYLPVIAIRELGMSDAGYSALIFASAVANVAASVAAGLFADRHGGFRRLLLVGAALGVLGAGVVWAFPSAPVLAVALLGPLAAFGATNALVFAKVKNHAGEFTPAEEERVTSLLRMMISLAWVVVPGATGLLLAGRPSLLPAFALAALAAAAGFAALLGLPPDRRHTTGPPAPSLDLGVLADTGLLLRVTGVALASAVLHVNGAVLPLIVTGRAGGDPTDVGTIVGYVALLEVVFIFAWGPLARRLTMPVALAVSLAMYLVYLAAVGTARGMLQVHAASVLGGVAAAAIITLPIPYLLDLVAGRPGLSASLMALNQFLGAGIGALIFAIGTALGGYPAAAVLGGVIGFAGAVLIAVLERRRPIG